MSEIEVKEKSHLLNGLSLWDYHYELHEYAFTDDIQGDIKEKTNLNQGNLGDWWIHPDGQPTYTWQQLIDLAIGILSCRATKLFVEGLYLENTPSYECKDVKKLPSSYVSGAKRIGGSSGDYTDYSAGTGFEGLKNMSTGGSTAPVEVKASDLEFRFFGKDESCMVEGTWLDWTMLACNILANENTKKVCPELYAQGLANSNY